MVLHGLFGMLDNWHTFARELSNNNLVVSMDLRNHGRSGHADTFSYAEMAEDVLETMHSMGMYQASILGHSMGGKVAMYLATQDSSTVSALISVDIAPKPYPPGHHDVINALQSIDPRHCESRSEAMAAFMNQLNDLGVSRFLMKNLKRDEQGGFSWRMNLPVIVDNYSEVIQGLPEGSVYDGPSLFVRGSKSGYIQNDDMEVILEHFPEAVVETINDAGHWIHAEQPGALLERVRHFLETV